MDPSENGQQALADKDVKAIASLIPPNLSLIQGHYIIEHIPDLSNFVDQYTSLKFEKAIGKFKDSRALKSEDRLTAKVASLEQINTEAV